MFRGQVRRRMRAVITGITGLALAGLVWAPGGSASQAPTTEPRQDSLEVLGSTISYWQGRDYAASPPTSKARPKFQWGVARQVSVALPGQWQGNESVETRFTRPGSEASPWYPNYVDTNGIVSPRDYIQVGTLKQAKSQATQLRGSTTVEIRLPANGPILSAQVSSWTTIPLLLLRNVKMTRQGQSIGFTGVLVDEKGKPVSAGYVYIMEFPVPVERPLDSGPLQPVSPTGRFALKSSTRPQSDYLAVTWAGSWVLDPNDISAPRYQAGPVYSKPFKYTR